MNCFVVDWISNPGQANVWKDCKSFVKLRVLFPLLARRLSAGWQVSQSCYFLMTIESTMMLVLLLVLAPEAKLVRAIACYECNQFPQESPSPCPAKRTVNYGLQHDVSSGKQVQKCDKNKWTKRILLNHLIFARYYPLKHRKRIF